MSHSCQICGAVFSRPSRLVIHTRTHTGERPFSCPCGRSYIRLQHLKRHKAKCTGEPSVQERPKSLLNKSADFKEYFCPTCNAGPFSKKKSVWAHIAIVHGERRFRCDKCDAAFPTRSKLDRHLSRHHNLKCPKCALIPIDERSNPDETFEDFLELQLHMAEMHPKQKLSCKTCGAQFSRLSQLRAHESTHIPIEDRKTFVCTYCTKENPDKSGENEVEPVAFVSKTSLRAHIKAVHSGQVRRYPCTHVECPAILSTKQKLQAHLARHERAAASKEVLRVFQRPSLLPRHERRPHSLTDPGAASSPRRRRKCVPIRDMQEAWETDSQSSIVAALNG